MGWRTERRTFIRKNEKEREGSEGRRRWIRRHTNHEMRGGRRRFINCRSGVGEEGVKGEEDTDEERRGIREGGEERSRWIRTHANNELRGGRRRFINSRSGVAN